MDRERPKKVCCQTCKIGESVILVDDSGISRSLPMAPVPGSIGITVSDIELSSSGVVALFRGEWRPKFGVAAASVGDVVLELVASGRERSLTRYAASVPTSRPPGKAREQDLRRITIHLLVASGTGARVALTSAPRRPAGPLAAAGRSGPGWLWLGTWPNLGADWPFLVGPLTFIAWQQECAIKNFRGAQ